MLAGLSTSGLVGPVKGRNRIGPLTIVGHQRRNDITLSIRPSVHIGVNPFEVRTDTGNGLMTLTNNGTMGIGGISATGAINAAGAITSSSNVIAAAASYFGISSRTRISSPADSILQLTNNAAADFTRMQLGGGTSSFPALGRSTTFLRVELADGTAGGGIQFSDGASIDIGTTTGTKIGNATTQKIGFWNTTPVVQPTAVPDASGGATIDAEARTAINDLLARLRTIGILAT